MLSRPRNLLVCIALVACAAVFSAASALGDPIAVRDLATLQDIDGLSVSPNGRWAAFVAARAEPHHNRHDVAWHVVDIASGQTRRVAQGGDFLPVAYRGMITRFAAPSRAVWSPNSAWIAFLRRDDGRTQVWRVRPDGGAVEQLTHNSGDVRNVVYAGNNRILFQIEPSQAQIADTLAAEARTGFLYDERFMPLYGRTPVAPRDVDPAQPNDRTASERATEETWVYDLTTKRERPANAQERAQFDALTAPVREKANFSAISPAGSVAWTDARDPDRRGVFPRLTIMAQLSSRSEPILCSADICTADRMDGLWWRNDQELVFVRNEGLRMQDRALYAWRPGSKEAARLILRTPDLFGAATGCGVAQDKLLCFYERPAYPRQVVAIDLDSGTIMTLYDPNSTIAGLRSVQSPERLAFRSESGVETYGYLVLPSGRRRGERLPLVIVSYYCGGFLRGGSGDETPIYPLAALGFAVLCISAPDDLERYARLNATEYARWERGPGMPMRRRITDALDVAITDLDRLGIIDPRRVAITGLSYGSEMVAYALPHMPRLSAAISAVGGLSPTVYPYLGRSPRRSYRTLFGRGAPSETPERWDEASFTPYVEKVVAPLLINVADHEFTRSVAAVTALEDAGRSVEMYVFPDEYHVKWQPAHRLSIYNRNIDWLNFWLRGVEGGMTGDASQYRRWRAMRENQCRLFGPSGTERGSLARRNQNVNLDDLVPWYCQKKPQP